MKNIRSTLATVWRISVPYFRSEDKLAGRGLLAAVIATELALVGLDVLLNQCLTLRHAAWCHEQRRDDAVRRELREDVELRLADEPAVRHAGVGRGHRGEPAVPE